MAASIADAVSLPKAPSGIRGLDEITGGLPRGGPRSFAGVPAAARLSWRRSSCCGGAVWTSRACSWRSRKPPTSWPQNVASLGFDLDPLVEQKVARRRLRAGRATPRSRKPASSISKGCSSASVTPSTPLAPSAWCSDTLEALFTGLTNDAIAARGAAAAVPMAQGQGVTAVITAERGTGAPTRHGLEEYVSDCVILLDHRVNDPGLHTPAPPRREVPRLRARHERVSVPDRRGRHYRFCPSPRWG